MHKRREANDKETSDPMSLRIGGRTNLTVIAKKAPNKNNKSGTKGIYQDRCGTWYAKIVFRGVEHRVKCTSQLQAIYRRKEMEMEYFDPVVKQHKKLLQKKKTKKGK